MYSWLLSEVKLRWSKVYLNHFDRAIISPFEYFLASYVAYSSMYSIGYVLLIYCYLNVLVVNIGYSSAFLIQFWLVLPAIN